MTNEEFVSLVREMRECQRKYFRTREKSVLMRSKALEKQVDEALSVQIKFER